MPGGQEKELKRRIKSVENTKQVTKAMEMIAAARLPKAQKRVEAARPYSEQITEVIRSLAATRDLEEDLSKGRDYSLILLGRKAQMYYRFQGYEIDHAFTGMSEQPEYQDAKEVAATIIKPFEEGDIDLVKLVYTQFLSAGTQRVAVRQFLPLDTEALAEGASDEGEEAAYEFEPAPAEILARLLPRYVEARLYAAMLEAAASELANRQRAMKSASDNAEELVTSLSRQMNRARQETITTEIMEVVGGAEALRGEDGEKDYFPGRLISDDFLPDEFSRT